MFSNLYPISPNLIRFLGILIFNWFKTDKLNCFDKCFGANLRLYNKVLTGLERNFLKNIGDDIRVFTFMYLFKHIRCPLLISLDIHAFLTVVNLKVSYNLPDL